jgi:hypothetical protein
MAHDVPILGAREIEPQLVAQVSRFILDQVQPYQADLLASHSALIYHLPFDKASLDARQVVANQMRGQYEINTGNEEIRISTLFQQILFRLVLLPFWVVRIIEQDGDIRPALVNGQTGQVALGKARKPKA